MVSRAVANGMLLAMKNQCEHGVAKNECVICWLIKEERMAVPRASIGDHINLPVVEDNWQHRSDGLRCSTCMWYAMKRPALAGVKEVGRCRRHAPTMAGFPVVYDDDWCGDHKLDEEKV